MPSLHQFRAGAAGFSEYAVPGFVAHHAVFFWLCRRAARLIETEIDFTPDPEPHAKPDIEPAGHSGSQAVPIDPPPAARSVASTTLRDPH
jgi:hypothetical protein